MGIFRNLKGTSKDDFRIGAANSGPTFVNNAGIAEVKDSAGVSFQIIRGKDPVGLDDLTTKRYVDNLTSNINLFVLNSSRNANLTNSYLRTPGNTPLNQSPYQIPYDCEIFAISFSSNGVETYDIELYKNANIISPPTVGNSELVLNVSSSSSGKSVLGTTVSISEDDLLAVFIRGSNINKPHVILHFRKV